ncbi:hypothetical protein ACFE04_020654 [Oxalis oulophora]
MNGHDPNAFRLLALEGHDPKEAVETTLVFPPSPPQLNQRRRKRHIDGAHLFNLFEPTLEFAHQAFQSSPLHHHNRLERCHNWETYAHSSIRRDLDFGLKPEGTKRLQWKKKLLIEHDRM